MKYLCIYPNSSANLSDILPMTESAFFWHYLRNYWIWRKDHGFTRTGYIPCPLMKPGCAVRIRASVTPPSADTTTITGNVWDSIICLTLLECNTVPTDVPPNFSTFIEI